ncbi:MAG TPA: RNA-directed DNA polymerase [Actinomycetota bacterium]|nr:RNA-directed DNA polymerase [Actinomycetota bacterium]
MDRPFARPPTREDAARPRFEPIPKPGGGLRWLTRLDPAGDDEFREAVRPLAGRIERALGPEVFALRTLPASDGWRLAPWGPARAGWRRTLKRVVREARPGTTFAVADVRDCYGSISPETIAALLGPEAARAIAVLRRLHDRGVRGLPIGPEPSAILANAVLSEMDRAIRRIGAQHLRWVDDLILWGAHSDVGRALDTLDDRAARMGLELHETKTRLLADREEACAVALDGRDSSIIAAP